MSDAGTDTDLKSVALLIRPNSGFARGVLRGIKSYGDRVRNWAFNFVVTAQTSQVVEIFQRQRLSGVLATVEDEALPALLHDLNVPLVNCANMGFGDGVPLVGVDDAAVGRLAAEHFLERGFRHFAFVGWPALRYSHLRLEGFARVLREAGHEIQSYADPTNVWTWSDDPAMQQWLTDLPKPVGLFAATDAMGLRVSELCRRNGLLIPEQVAVVGVDDDDLFCGLAHPSLSSVKTPLEQIGFESARLLDRLIAGYPPPPGPILLPPAGVVTRRSSDVFAIDDPELLAAIRYIHDNAHRPIGIKQVLDEVSLSRRSLERRCRAALGRTPLEELLRVRLRRACDLLSGTDLSMSAVAQRSGFSSGKQLSMTFHQQLGLTPSDYRARSRVRE